jgi:hypothetical protein
VHNLGVREFDIENDQVWSQQLHAMYRLLGQVTELSNLDQLFFGISAIIMLEMSILLSLSGPLS